MLRDRLRLLRRPFRPMIRWRAKQYLRRHGMLNVLASGAMDEIPPVQFDLFNLHRIVRTRQPRIVLEFGVGFSTLAIAHALHMNGAGKVFSVDANPQWIENVRRKIPDHLRDYVELRHSDVEVAVVHNELCLRYRNLPNIVPDFVYLDGPDPRDVKGVVDGLTYTPEYPQNGVRQEAAADLLLYESSLKRGFFLLIDARYNNMHFLHRNLRRKYRVRWNRSHHFATFELLEHTGRH